MRIASIVTALALSACSVSAPVTGSLSTGEPISGVAVGSMSGEGTVQVAGGGVDCHGAYNAMSQAPLLSVPLTCAGGVTGMAQVDRAPDLMSGAGTFTLSDGRAGTFSYAGE